MEKITKYKAEDGSIFNDEEKCLEYEQLCNQVKFIMHNLNPLPVDDNCNFGNGGGYIQQDGEVVEKARMQLTKTGNEFFKMEKPWGFNSIGRVFNDSDNNVLYSAWIRLSNIDYLYREWGQGYYAVNPTKGVQKPYVE